MISNNNLILSDALDQFKGKECWAATGGEGTGSMFSIHFGKKIKRAREINNPTLSEEFRKYEGEYIFFIEMAFWGLFSGEVVVTTAKDHAEKIGKLVATLKGRKLLDYKISDDICQYDLSFDGNKTLKINFREGFLLPTDDLFTLYQPSGVISVSKNNIEFEKKQGSTNPDRSVIEDDTLPPNGNLA